MPLLFWLLGLSKLYFNAFWDLDSQVVRKVASQVTGNLVRRQVQGHSKSYFSQKISSKSPNSVQNELKAYGLLLNDRSNQSLQTWTLLSEDTLVEQIINPAPSD